MTQRDCMRKLYQKYGNDENRLVAEYAAAEDHGLVRRKRNENNLSPEQYARALYLDGAKKGWLFEPPRQ